MRREAEQTQHFTSVAAPVFLCDLLIHTQPLTSRLEIPLAAFPAQSPPLRFILTYSQSPFLVESPALNLNCLFFLSIPSQQSFTMWSKEREIDCGP